MSVSSTHHLSFTAKKLLSLGVEGLEGPPLLRLEGNTELKELEHDVGEVLDEQVVVLGVLLDPGTHGLVFDDGQVGWQHHQALGLGVLVLWSYALAKLERNERMNVPAWDRSTS